MKTYETLAELVEAYKSSGEINQDDPLWLDNDTASVYAYESEGHWASDVPPHRVFTMHPEQILREALTLLGVPYDHV